MNIIDKDLNSTTKLNKNKFVFVNAGLDDYVSKYGFFETSLIQWVKETYHDQERILLDIGAHIGSYSLELANNFAEVHSFEPNPEVFNHLCANVALHELSYKVYPHRIALSSKKGTSKYYFRSTDGGGNGIEELGDNSPNYTTLKTDKLDNYNFDKKIGFIKMDVEGHEFDVLKGAFKTLKNSNFPPILFESWEIDIHPEYDQKKVADIHTKVFELLKDYGYEIKSIIGYSEMFIAVQE